MPIDRRSLLKSISGTGFLGLATPAPAAWNKRSVPRGEAPAGIRLTVVKLPRIKRAFEDILQSC